MKKLIAAIILVNLAKIVSAQTICPPVCCGGGSFDWLEVQLIGMGPLSPPKGFIEIGMYVFDTLEDDCDATIRYLVKRECSMAEASPRMPGSWKNPVCAVICGNPGDCPDGIGCMDCPGLFTHSCGTFSYYFELAGKGTFIVEFQGQIAFMQPFDFGGESEYFDMQFTDIAFLNKDYSEIQTNDVFDAMEAVGIQLEAEFLGDMPANAVGVILRSDLGQDTMVVELSLDQVHWNMAQYAGILPAGTFLQIIGDPDDVLPPYSEAEISAEPVSIDCPNNPPITVPIDYLSIANYQLWVKEISFEFDFDLCKDGPASEPGTEEPILDPVWVKDEKSDPVAYRRGNTLQMNVKVECNRTPYHDFDFWIMGTGGEDQGSYITSVCPGILSHSNQSLVSNVSPRDGSFPDHVGVIDPLNYLWWIEKMPGPNIDYFRFMNSSSHKIFLTYDTPLLEDINVLALDKICNYANGEKEPAIIAELGVGGIYGEGWDYNPSKDSVFIDPLDVIRQETGLCADYANLLTCLYKSIGINANSVTIYNKSIDPGTNFWLYWRYTGLGGFPTCLLSKWLTSCDNDSRFWAFRYHAVSYAADLLCDASLGIIDSRANYEEWWRYYLQPPLYYLPLNQYLDSEPPSYEPTYHDWPEYIPFDRILPPEIIPVLVNFYHP